MSHGQFKVVEIYELIFVSNFNHLHYTKSANFADILCENSSTLVRFEPKGLYMLT